MIFFIDSLAHYTTLTQGNRKWDAANAPTAGAGAFGAPGVRPVGGPTGQQKNFASINTIEISCYAICTAQYGQWIYLLNGGGNQTALYIYGDGHIQATDGIAVQFGNSAAGVWSFGVQHHLYVKVVSHASAGTILVKVDGVTVLNLSGLNTAPQGAAGFTNVRFFGDGSSNVANCIFSHFALADTSGDITGQPRTECIFPRAAGNYAQWSTLVGAATHWQAVNEHTPDDDTSYVASATVGQIDTYLYDPLAGTASTVLAIAPVPMARKDDAAARSIASLLRIAATDYPGATKAVPGSYGYLQEVLPTNPNTAAAWTIAAVNAIEAGPKVIA